MASPNLVLLAPPEPTAARGPSLGDLETTLQALLDCADTVPPELEAEWFADVQAALSASKAKRDRYQQFLVGLERQIAEVDGAAAAYRAEVSRLESLKDSLQGKHQRAENYVLRVIQSLGEPDAKGKYPHKLQGSVVVFSAQKNPVSVDDAIDITALPRKYQKVTVSMPGELWDQIADALELELRAKVVEVIRLKVEPVKSEIKVDLTADPPVEVPGARLNPPVYKLVRK